MTFHGAEKNNQEDKGNDGSCNYFQEYIGSGLSLQQCEFGRCIKRASCGLGQSVKYVLKVITPEQKFLTHLQV